MANVGLPRPEKKSAVDNTLIVSVGLLILVGAIYGGVFFYKNSLQDRVTQIQSDTAGLQAQLSSEQALRVADFMRRSEDIGMHMDTMMIPSDALGDLESTVLDEVTIKTLEYSSSGEQIELNAVTDAVKNVARQMVAFKEKFSEVSAGRVGLGQEGDVEFTISMKRGGNIPATEE